MSVYSKVNEGEMPADVPVFRWIWLPANQAWALFYGSDINTAARIMGPMSRADAEYEGGRIGMPLPARR